MTFLNPLVLIGLAAAAIPILLHLFSLRRLEKIEFSTLTFLKELQKTKIRRLKLRQLLLLFLRTLLVILIVTAFSRPTLRTSFYGGENSRAKTTAVLILDNSYSMTSSDAQGQLLKQAKEAAVNVLSLMKDGDEVFVIRTSETRSAGTSPSSTGIRDFSAARVEIRSTEPSYLHATLEDALRYAAKLLSTSKNLNKEVYIFSDFKVGSLWGGSRTAKRVSVFPDDTRFFLIPVGPAERQNLGIESLRIENALFGVGRPITIRTRIRNWGPQDQRNDVVSVFLNGTRIAQKAVDILSRESADVEFVVTPTSTGFVDGTVEIPDDDLDFDNRRSFAVYIPQQLKILLVGSPRDLHYLRVALSAQPVQGESSIKLAEISPQRLSTNEIRDADVMVVANVRNLSSVQQIQIRNFVEAGGGLVYFPGSETDSSSFQATWTHALGVPPISFMGKSRNSLGAAGPNLEFDRIDFRHPIFQGMFAQEPSGKQSSPLRPGGEHPQIESPSIAFHIRYLTSVRSIPIITLSDDAPFLFEQRVKKGIVMMFSVSATTDWSNFPLKGLFVPLIHSSVAYAAQQNSILPVITVGDEADVNLKNQRLSKVVVQDPDKVDVTSDIVSSGGESALHFRGTSLPGIYSVKSGNTVLRQFVATLSPNESNTVRADAKQIDAMFRELGIPDKSVESIGRETNLQKVVIQSRVGLELWKYFIGAALLVAFLESFVARTAKRDLLVNTSSSTGLSSTIPQSRE